MPIVEKSTIREARRGRVFYRNPAVRTCAGKLRPGSVVFEVDDRQFEVHTVYGAAAMLGRSPLRVQQLLEADKLRGYRVGHDWLVLDLDLRRFIKRQRAKVRKRFAGFLEEREPIGLTAPVVAGARFELATFGPEPTQSARKK